MSGYTHECPADGCTAGVRQEMLMCRSHWYMVPKAHRTAVWDAWRDGAGAGTSAHTAAISAAIEAVNARIAARGGGA